MARWTVGFWVAAVIALGAVGPAASASAGGSQEFSAQSRPHVTIHPRRVQPGPHAKRHCVSWLQKEYRVSGTVITPQMRCWWR